MNKTRSFRFAAFWCLATLVALGGCGGGSGSSPGGSYSIGGTVSNLPPNATVTLVNNGGDALNISASGTFKFASNVASGAAYAVTVQSHTPGVGCDVGGGSGTVGSSAVTGVTVTCRAGVASVLYAFDGSPTSVDGQNPYGGLVADSAGNLYGTTSYDGSVNSYGTVFKIDASGYHKLYVFGSQAGDGWNPSAGLIADGANNLYGTTYFGGAHGAGTVFKITPSGAQTVLYSFGGVTGDGQNPIGALAFDSNGNLYGTTFGGGANGDGTVFKLSFNGSTVTESVYSFNSAMGDGAGPKGGLLIDSGGNIYGTTSNGGNGTGTVFKITFNGTAATESALYSFDASTSNGANPNGTLVMDSSGNLYGTTLNGGTFGNGTVFTVNFNGGVPSQSVLYSFSGVSDGQQPYAGLVFDRAGNLYGTTSAGGANGAGTVFKFSPTTTPAAVTVLYTLGSSASDGQDSQGGLVIDSAGNIYGTTFLGGPGGINGAGTVFKID